MKTINGELILFFDGKFIFKESKTMRIYEIADETFYMAYRMVPATSWVGGAIRQTSENASLECEVNGDNSIRNIRAAQIPIEAADNFKFTLAEISCDNNKLCICYIQDENDSL